MSDRPEFTDTACTYFLCPDASCTLFTKPDCHVPCESKCPHVKRMRKAVVCWQCKKVDVLPGDHFSCCRVDCECGAALFTRMSSVYRRVNT